MFLRPRRIPHSLLSLSMLGGLGWWLSPVVSLSTQQAARSATHTPILDPLWESESAAPQDTMPTLGDHGYDYDLAVIGGGSGGLAAAKMAAQLGAKVIVLDYVTPSPQGTRWGLGGTCVNVGCIPKKLMHTAALHGQAMRLDAPYLGWGQRAPDTDDQRVVVDWESLTGNIDGHIRSVNFSYLVQLRDHRIRYENALARFVDPHTLELCKKGASSMGQHTEADTTITANKILIAVGGRPSLPEPETCAGLELAYTSDDIFTLQKPPGKSLVVGGSYVALETAGFLSGLGFDTTVMIRSIPLREFDQQMAALVVNSLESLCGTRVLRGVVPQSLQRQNDGRVLVTWSQGGAEEFDTVIFATGRKPATGSLSLHNAGVSCDDHGYVVVNSNDQTSCDNIFAIGDCAQGVPELTPVAVQAGQLLARRLFGGATDLMDYSCVPTTVFTPLEYACVGLSEEQAVDQFGPDAIEVYHMQASPYEHVLVYERDEFPAYIKCVVMKQDQERVLGLHVFAPSAGEILQGFAVAFRKGLFKRDLDNTVGIHPTTAELFTQLTITKSSGQPLPSGGCPSCA